MIYYEDWYTNIPMKVYSASKLSLSGILRGFHPVSDFIPEFHGDFPLDKQVPLFSSQLVHAE